jgi:hypothetical protein
VGPQSNTDSPGEDDHATLTFPNKFERDPAAAKPIPSVAPSVAPSATSNATPPDPPVLSSLNHWLLGLRYVRGTVRIDTVQAVHLQEASEGDRFTGRFALELWSHQTLLDRLRFDFPLLAAETTPPSAQRPVHREASFAPGADVSVSLQVPTIPEINRAQIVDRVTGKITEIAWPPVVTAIATK